MYMQFSIDLTFYNLLYILSGMLHCVFTKPQCYTLGYLVSNI